ncbi:MAG: type II toxin-antitoxin system PemK/MazF family toxin [Spirochaetes bacterium]|nr:type II toxin-antitoxin system PemK/MazF family toxin [Spirochaetota bacterium]
MVKNLIPARGDIIAFLFDPQSGHEQKGWRPALVLSNRTFNSTTGLAIVCPITSTNRGLRLHIQLPDNLVTHGVVMVDQVKSIDFRARKAKIIEQAPPEIVNESLSIFNACVSDD